MIDNIEEGAGYADFFGKPLNQYEIMKDIKSLKEIDLLVVIPSTTLGTQLYMTMLTIPNRIPLLVGCSSGGAPGAINLYKAGEYKGVVAGLRGAAEYEKLLGVPGLASAGMDAQSAAHMLMIALIFLANLSYFATKRMNSGGVKR